MENNPRLQQLIDSYINKTLSEDEKVEMLNYFDDPNFIPEIEARFGEEYAQESGSYEMDELYQQQLLKRVFEFDTVQKQPGRGFKLWPRIAIAAAISAIIFSVGVFYLSDQKNSNITDRTLVNDVAPGKEGATLTLANGKKILINEVVSGDIANQSGVKISKTKNGQIQYEIIDQHSATVQYNTLATTRAEQISVRLPDGTLVFLNAATTLKYPTSFAKMSKREVTITGEGYFEVFKDKLHPFIVKTNSQEIQVLGTHFNVNAYADEPSVKTTLLEGSVKVNSNSQTEILRPNQQSSSTGGKITIRAVDTDEVIAWKNNEFLFKDDDFKTNMRKIARWYDVEVVYENGIAPDFKIGGFSSRSRNLNTILKLMQQTGKVHFRTEGRTVYVSN